MTDVPYMGINHWHAIKQRPRHLVEGLAHRHQVVCVNPVGLLRWEKAQRIIDHRAQAIDLGKAGRLAADDLPRCLVRFDVLLIPFIITGLAKAMNPAKAHEYLATGKLMVATAMRELQALGHVRNLAADHEAFVCAVGQVLAEQHDAEYESEMQSLRRTVATENSWQRRIDQINQVLDQGL